MLVSSKCGGQLLMLLDMLYAGRDLPPLFNWQKGELDHADPALVTALQPDGAASSSQAAARPSTNSS